MNNKLDLISKNDKKAFLMLYPDYANVGDIAISIVIELSNLNNYQFNFNVGQKFETLFKILK